MPTVAQLEMVSAGVIQAAAAGAMLTALPLYIATSAVLGKTSKGVVWIISRSLFKHWRYGHSSTMTHHREYSIVSFFSLSFFLLWQGDQCKFDHDAELEKRKEICKFYLQGYCTKGENCIYMHNILY